MSVNHHLLFFDTFSHEASEISQLDLVQFPRAVQVSEVRVIPLGARVKADFPGGFRLGATNPSQFEIEFFVNDLSKRGAATFENIGILQYTQHGTIQLEFDKKPPTDGLLIRGSYNTITLAVYGSLTKVQREPSPPKPSAPVRPEVAVAQPPPEKVNTHERIRDWLEDTKPPSPAEFDAATNKTWGENAPPPIPLEVINKEYERDKENRSRNKDKRSYDRSQSREKSWDRSEKSASRREKKDKGKDKELVLERDKEREVGERDKVKDLERELEREKKHLRGSRERYDEEISSPYDLSGSRRRRSLDEWDERRSEMSDRSVRRPRTPLEPPNEPPLEILPQPNSPFSEVEGERNIETIRGGSILPPPILSEEMEAISDDEVLPDLPAEDMEAVEDFVVEEGIELIEDALVDHPPIEEVIEEAEVFEYEEIMSDEDDLPEYQYEEDYLVEEWEDWIKPFVPQDLVELPALLFIRHPVATEYEKESYYWQNSSSRAENFEDKISMGNKLAMLVNETSLPTIPIDKMLDADLSQDIPEETGEIWVQTVEHACQLLPKALVYLEDQKEILQKLFTWVHCGLDFDLALSQKQPVFKIRHMKAGIRLTHILLQCSSDISNSLLHQGVLDKLFNFNEQPYLALSIRLLILRGIDAAIRTPAGLHYFIYDRTESKTAYERVLELLSSMQQSRVKVALAATVRKIHILEICEKLRSDTLSILDFIPHNDIDNNSHEEPSSITTDRVGEDLPEDNKMDLEINHEQTSTNHDQVSSNLDHVSSIQDQTSSNQNQTCSNLDQTSSNQDQTASLEDKKGFHDSSWSCNIPSSLLQSVISCQKEILRTYTYANQLLVQPNRWLPGFKQFQLPKNHQDPYPYIYTVFETSGFLQSISVLLVTPAMCQNPSILGYVKSLLSSFLVSEHGLRYLAWERKVTMLIIKALLQFGEDSRDTNSDSYSLYHLGVQMSYMLHIVHQLDCIAQLGGSSMKLIPKGEISKINTHLEPDYSQAAVHFSALESLLMSPSGKEAIISVLGLPYYTEILFPYLHLEPGEDHETHPSKATCFGYVVDLLSFVVKFQDDAKFLEVYAEQLNNLIIGEGKDCFKTSEDYNKLCEILPWVSLPKNPEVFTYDKLINLSTAVQDNLEKLDKFPGELITALRILCHLTIPKTPVGEFDSEEHNNELIEELKYKYATIQLFSSDLPTNLISLLTKLFAIYQQPFLHSSNFVGSEGGLVLMLIKPTLALLNNILGYIIKVRNTDFKDLTAVVPLVQTYILLQAFPNTSPYITTAHQLQQTVISILLGYTQVVYTTEGEEVLSKSLWTQMMAEIFKYLMSAPHTMVSVITLITELLPLPLPIQTQIPLTQEETLQAIRVRKLWSAHLYSLAPTLQDMIHKLGLATHPLLTHSLRRMCVAFSDLSAPMALLVAKATLDLLLQTHRLDQRTLNKEEIKVGSTNLKEEPSKLCPAAHASQQTARALNMLASLVSHAPTKTAVLHLLRGGASTLAHATTKTEEKYSSLISTWCSILSLQSKVPSHVGAQECLVTIIQYLFDYENAMQVHQDELQEGGTYSTVPIFSLSGVPHKDLLLPLVEALVDVIHAPSSASNIIQHVLRVIIRLLDHNYGFFYVKNVLDKKKGCLHPILCYLSTNFSKDNADMVFLLRDTLDLCQCLISPDDCRTFVVTPAELGLYLGWKSDVVGGEPSSYKGPQEKKDSETLKTKKDEEEGGGSKEGDKKLEDHSITTPAKKDEDSNFERTQHPLKVLELLVVADGSEEEMIESFYDDISQLISLLDKEGLGSTETTASADLEEPSAVGLESLQALFASRIVWTFPCIDDDLHSLWFLPPSFQDIEDKDSVSVNLMETCRKYAGNFDLIGTLHKVIKGQAFHSISPQKLAKIIPKYKPSATAIRPDRRGRPYVAPMRGRSFGRGMNIRSDPFRSRPPNTSRPPSLHVDDFVALESTGHQPTGPTGYNKISFGRGKMMLDSMRGRGRPRGDNRGGRFFHRPPFRGDGGRVMGRGIGMRRGPGWVFRGDGSQRGNFRGAPMNQMPPRFIRGRPFVRGGLGGMPGGPKDRFQQKFIDRGRRDLSGGRHMRGFR